MDEDKQKIECRMETIGTTEVQAKVSADLDIVDPDEEDGKQIIKDATDGQ